MLTFVARTVAKRTLIGQRQTVQNEEYYCHAFNRDGLVSICITAHIVHAKCKNALEPCTVNVCCAR